MDSACSRCCAAAAALDCAGDFHDAEAFESLNAYFHHHSAKPYAVLRLLKNSPLKINEPDNRPDEDTGNHWVQDACRAE